MGTERPKESEGQLIGKRASRALASHLPDEWTEVDQSGDGDYGIDYTMQVKDSNSEMSGIFFLQLKGTTSPEYVNDGKEISYQFKSSTLNYYVQSETPIMVAVVDLSKSDNIWNCPTYYKYLDEDFLDSIADQRRDNKKVTIRLSTSDVINKDLDFLPVLLKRLKQKSALTEVRRAVELHSTNVEDDILALAEAFSKKPVYLEVAREDTEAPWIENPDNHNVGKLKYLFDAISNNQITYAKTLIEEISKIGDLTDHEKAEFFSLRASLISLNGDYDSAELLHKKAYETFGSSRYKVNYLESRFRNNETLPPDELEGMISSLDGGVYRECVLKARCLALMDKEEEAIVELDRYPVDKVFIAKMLIYTIGCNHDELEKISELVDLDSLKPRQMYLYHVLLGRRLFYRGINYDFEGDSTLKVIPFKGKEKYNFDVLKESFNHIKNALEYARNIGYPNDLVVLLDVAQIVFGIFGEEEYLIRYIDSILQDRPDSRCLKESIILLRFNSKQYNSVIELLSSFDELSPEQASLLIAANYHCNKKSEALRVCNLYKEVILKEKPQNHGALLCIAAQCAYEMLQPELEKEYLNHVAELEDGGELLAISRYIKTCNESPEKRGEQNKVLYEDYERLGSPFSIAMQLFAHLDTESEDEVEWICPLAEKILEVRELYPEENITYAFALSKLTEWEKLESLCRKVEAISGLDHLWSLLLASAVDGQGRTGEALDILDARLDDDKRSLERAENYVYQCVNLGFFDKAEKKLEEMLGGSDSAKRLNILELLMFIYSSDDSNPEKLINSIIRFGETVDQNNEEQEGKYLLAFLTMTNRQDVDVSAHVEDFRSRLSKYVECFPNSKILKMATMPEEATGDQVMENLRALAGISDEQVKRWQRSRNQLRANKLPIPYARLSGFLDDVGDVFGSWVLGGHFKGKRKEYLLHHSKEKIGFHPEKIKEFTSTIVVDETSLLVMSEVGVLGKALEYFDSIVIDKFTYDRFSKASHFVMGSPYSGIPRRIVRELGNYINKIRLLSANTGSQNIIDEYKSIILQSENPVFLCDDLYLAEHIRYDINDLGVINTLTVIDIIGSNDLITLEERANYIQRLCSFGISSPSLKFSHVVDCLLVAVSKGDGVDVLETEFTHIFDALFVWGGGIEIALDKLCKIFTLILKKSEYELEISALDKLLDVWLVRYPEVDRLSILTAWFINCLSDIAFVQVGTFDARGKGHLRLWDVYRRQTLERDTSLSLGQLFRKLSLFILRLDAGTSSDVYEAVLKSFSPDSKEARMFAQVFTPLSVEKRVSELQNR